MTDLATTLVLGGARSGKSAFAERLIADSGLARIYLATAGVGDDEMKARIAHHRAQRGAGWTTIEEPLALVDALTREATHGRAVLVECLMLWLSNLMIAVRVPEIEARQHQVRQPQRQAIDQYGAAVGRLPRQRIDQRQRLLDGGPACATLRAMMRDARLHLVVADA